MNALGSFLLGVAALVPLLLRHLSKPLRWYLLVTSFHGFIQADMLSSGIPINSHLYGFEWYLARIVQLFCAVLYVIEIAGGYKLKPLFPLVVTVGLIFGITPWPSIWFNWLAFVYAMALAILGAMIASAPDKHARIMAAYWVAMCCWQYTFLRESANQSSVVWRLNWWLPSTISISAFLALAV